MYDITPQFSLFGVHAKSLFPETTKNSFGEQMPPIVGSNIEFGAKFAFMDGKLNGTFSYYDIEQTGGFQYDSTAENLSTQRWDSMTPAQRAVAFPGTTDRSQLLGDQVPGAVQDSTGFEIDLNYQPTRSLVFQFSFANNDQEIVEAANAASVGLSNQGHVKTRWAVLTKYTFIEGGMEGLYIGTGIHSTGQALQDYQGGVPRYNPSFVGAEAFAGYRFRIGEYDSMVQLNIKNITQVDEFVGWVPNGTALATERYRVGTPMTFSVTFGIDL
jgi:iron complex outermembrane receptor protein